jgi:imidazolonepropionase-like amidohydrolase
VRRLHDAGRLALGSDSRLTGARDLLDELYVAASCSDLAPAELLRLVTVDAARVLRLTDRGVLRPGAHADCVIVRPNDAGDVSGALLSTRRDAIRAVVRDGVPLVADPDLAGWLAWCGVDAVAVRLDGRPKLVARHLLPPEVAALELGLEVA